MICQKVKGIDAELKEKIDKFNEKRNELGQLKKKDTGNLAQRDLSPLIYENYDEKYFVPHDSEFLHNMIVIVPKSKLKDFQEGYVTSDDKNEVVPGSAKELKALSDPKDGATVWRVVVFQKYPEPQRLRTIGTCVAKEFTYDITGYKADLEKIKQLELEIKTMSKKFKDTCYLIYSELFIASMHLKVMRLYIDGVLRFGIPPMFSMCIILPGKGYEKRLLENMTKQFAQPGTEEMYGTKDQINDTEDFFPFVLVHLSLD